jgi:hypothetical protein
LRITVITSEHSYSDTVRIAEIKRHCLKLGSIITENNRIIPDRLKRLLSSEGAFFILENMLFRQHSMTKTNITLTGDKNQFSI